MSLNLNSISFWWFNSNFHFYYYAMLYTIIAVYKEYNTKNARVFPLTLIKLSPVKVYNKKEIPKMWSDLKLVLDYESYEFLFSKRLVSRKKKNYFSINTRKKFVQFLIIGDASVIICTRAKIMNTHTHIFFNLTCKRCWVKKWPGLAFYDYSNRVGSSKVKG
jgi:hypothetical protein